MDAGGSAWMTKRIWLVDTHAEGDGRHHHRRLGLQELLQPSRAHVFVEARVIGQRRHSRGDQLVSELVDPVARAGVDHPGPLRPFGHQFQHAPVSLAALALCRQGELRACKAVDELQRVSEPQLGADVPTCAGIGGGSDRQARHFREYLGQSAEHAVFGAEVVAPLADAVGLVDGHECKREARQAL